MNKPVIVFVKLGPSKAKHLWVNLRNIKVAFPEIRIVLIGDQESDRRKALKIGLEFSEYTREAGDSELLLRVSAADFRSGFWVYTLERLFALLNWHRGNADARLLHLESDLSLLANFPIAKFFKLKKLAWPAVNDNHDMAGLLFSPHGDESSWLLESIRYELSKDISLNDMTLMSVIRKKNLERVQTLPTWSPAWNSPEIQLPPDFTDNFEFFGGIFDAASIGTWLIGQDPRNHFGLVIRHDKFSDYEIDPGLLQFSFNPINEILEAKRFGVSSTIFNLHIHSKERQYFENKSKSRSLSKAASKALKPKKWITFKFSAFFYIIVEAYKASLRKAAKYFDFS